MPKAAATTEQVRVTESLAGSGAQVDATAGIIRGVKLIGFESKNGRSYPPDVLRSAVGMYEGVKVNVDHPKNPGDPRSVAERIGSIKGARFVEGKGVFGDFHFNPKHALAEQVAWDAEHNPDAVGFSHNATLKFKPGAAVNGKRAVESIHGVRSLDLVADPATTSGFFEHTEAREGLLADKAKMDDLIGAACDLLSEVRYGHGGKLTPQQRAAQALSVARDLIAELEPTKESEDMDLKNLTVEELRAARPDLVTAVTEQRDESQELEQLREKVKAMEAREAKAKQEGDIRAALESAGLDAKDKSKVSDVFMEQLFAAKDSATREALISDRKSLVGTKPTQATEGRKTEKPTTTVTEGAVPSDSAGWLKRLRSRSTSAA